MAPIDPLQDGISMVRLIDWMGNSVDIVADARQSFDTEQGAWSERDQKLLNYLVKHKHTSPFRGVVFKWQVKAPLFIARQWWKHVIGGAYANDQLGWNEKSFRYCEAEEDQFYMPRQFRYQSDNNKQASAGPVEEALNHSCMIEYAKGLQAAKQAYNSLLAMGVSREQARGVMPTAAYTSFVWTCSLQALLHFLSLRNAHDAQGEIQAYAQALHALARPIVPEAFDAFEANGSSF